MFTRRNPIAVVLRKFGSVAARRERRRCTPGVAALESRALLSVAGATQQAAALNTMFNLTLGRSPTGAEVQGLSPAMATRATRIAAAKGLLATHEHQQIVAHNLRSLSVHVLDQEIDAVNPATVGRVNINNFVPPPFLRPGNARLPLLNSIVQGTPTQAQIHFWEDAQGLPINPTLVRNALLSPNVK